ncbi:hypothetical protein H5410_006265 [Solanum commersonii]|uniref:Pseudouridine synthase RsuA/RluA-like domain-containing protein n=1 Tax=Solanum commersonii TaxID=4109 RepID=A0A9J6AAT5_SOLCO|nr:hypothetical protein H5410_006265 [Solanum commersonii]
MVKLYLYRCINSECNTMRKICKIYRALVSGVMDMDEVVIKQPIGTIKYPGVAKGLYVASPSEDTSVGLICSDFFFLGKPALSSVCVLERDSENNCTLVQVEIQSGRPHQIRIHLSFIGYPLIGDPLYVSGGQPKCFHPELMDESFEKDGWLYFLIRGYQRPENPVPGDCGYNLHAHQIGLIHPITNEITLSLLSLYTFISLSKLQHLFQLSFKHEKNAKRASQTPASMR